MLLCSGIPGVILVEGKVVYIAEKGWRPCRRELPRGHGLSSLSLVVALHLWLGQAPSRVVLLYTGAAQHKGGSKSSAGCDD